LLLLFVCFSPAGLALFPILWLGSKIVGMNTDATAPEEEGCEAKEPAAKYLAVLQHGPGSAAEVKQAQKALRHAYMKAFGQRAKLARGSMEVSEAAAAIGVHRNTIWNIERGDTLPDTFELQLMAKVYGVAAQSLVGECPVGPAGPPGGAPRSVRAIEMGQYIYVPHFDITVSAGPGSFHNIEHVIAMRPFDAGFIRGDLGIQHDEIAMCTVVGRSALPELKPRDTIMVDLRDRSVAQEGLHVVRLDDALILKKLQRLPGKVLRVSSSNQEYEPFEISGEESQRDFEVIGRVRWSGVTYH
jgi:ribosome-binding protein aMBF1 (putative translation factor)